jgi:hypothetical protein
VLDRIDGLVVAKVPGPNLLKTGAVVARLSRWPNGLAKRHGYAVSPPRAA